MLALEKDYVFGIYNTYWVVTILSPANNKITFILSATSYTFTSLSSFWLHKLAHKIKFVLVVHQLTGFED